ncbi:uncharacterized protein C2orf42 isoform X2 [Anabrus simplex]|uniref:uncharacterized protein C2orf42 isoform X2 n=1 Tax=Anabrus simplex TaxID=316456 RepID=UPI0034DD2431
MPNDDRLKALLSDLGRATLRGVRKCPKCGTYNGTRGLSCKNKSCDVVFKEAGEKRKMSTEACKLITGTTTQVFSVRVRDKGPDYRGFVQLPVIQNGLDGDQGLDSEVALITHTSALCFVDTCQRSFDASVLKCHEKTPPLTLTTCQHIQAALRCYAEAQALTLKSSVLSSLNISNDMKQSIWLLATETTGPLVQRVSKNIMAVKCKASPKHPLGYLHFSFFMSKLKDRVENKYFCSCTAFKGQVKHATNKDDPTFKKCVHFYACICAFASDRKLTEEFAYYINLDKPIVIPTSLSPTSEEHQQLVAILNEETGSCEVEVEVLPDEAALLEATGITVSDDGSLHQVHGLEVMSTDPVEVQIHEMDPTGLSFGTVADTAIMSEPSPPMELLSIKRKREDQTILSLPEIVSGIKKSAGVVNCGNSNKKSLSSIGLKKQEPADENTVNTTFIQWLASVTERINQTMHFQFSGKPDPLVFHVPQMPLEITRSFVENRDGTYEPYQPCKDENESFRKTNNQPLIKPLELKTYLKVGNTAPDQVEPTPFLIEWIPDILPVSKIGELKIRFEFGHKRNGHAEKHHCNHRNSCKLDSQCSDDISITRIEPSETILDL